TALLNKKYRYFDYKWDLVFWVTALPIVAAAADITKLLFAGDWDFWTDWKDRQWWVTLTPFAMIIIPSAIQYIQWLAWRFPTGFTDTAGGPWLGSRRGRVLTVGSLREFPAELCLARHHRPRRHHHGLDPVEDEEFRDHFRGRRHGVQHRLLGRQLRHPRAVPAAR